MEKQQRRLIKMLRERSGQPDSTIAQLCNIQTTRFHRVATDQQPVKAEEYFNMLKVLRLYYNMTPEDAKFFYKIPDKESAASRIKRLEKKVDQVSEKNKELQASYDKLIKTSERLRDGSIDAEIIMDLHKQIKLLKGMLSLVSYSKPYMQNKKFSIRNSAEFESRYNSYKEYLWPQ